jgi:Tol biopolymer transport system component
MIPRGANWELRLKDLENDAERVLVSDVKSEVVPYPAMRPDGMKVAFSVEENQRPSIYLAETSPDATGKSEKLCENCGTPYDWSPDGTKILYIPYHQPRPWPVYLLPVDNRQKIELLRHPKYDLFGARFSPDGCWISFQATQGVSTSTRPFCGGDSKRK